MNEEYILAGNAIIDRFTFGDENTCTANQRNELLYDTDWNWLMQTVFKIESLSYRVKMDGISVSVLPILETEPIFSLVCGDLSKKIELVWGVCLEFILWYNSKPKSVECMASKPHTYLSN